MSNREFFDSNFVLYLRKFLDLRDYDSLKYLYELEAAKTVKLLSRSVIPSVDRGLLCCLTMTLNRMKIKKLEAILSKYSEYDWEYLNISNSLLHFYFQTDELSKFEEVYNRITNLFKSVKVRTIDELEILIKCRYNFCRYLWLNQQTERAISETFETIGICLKNNSFYCLANLYCLLGNVSEGFANKDAVKQYFVTAQHAYL